MPAIPTKCIGIVGSRRRDSDEDYQACLAAFMAIYKPGDLIVSGGCPQGGDRFAEVIAEELKIPIKINYPDKSKLDQALLKSNPRAAYAVINYARNSLIASDCNVLIAVVAEDRKGGTEDTVKKAIKLGKKVIYA